MLSAEPTWARASHEPALGPLLSVAVTGPPGGELVVLAVRPGPVMVRDWAPEVPPPGAGVNTVMLSAPELTRSLARMVAVSWVADTNVVARLLPLTRTTEAGVKLLPVAVRVKAAPPAPAVAGLKLVSVGAGGGAVATRFTVFELQLLPTQLGGLATLTATLPVEAMSAASTAMVNCVGETALTVRDCPPTGRWFRPRSPCP